MAGALKCPICEFENPDGEAKCRRCGTPLRLSGANSGSSKAAGGGQRLRQGQLLANRYYIVAEIGRGGMGSIYRAKDNTLKEEVALKTLLPQFLQDKHVVERFFNEARIARQLSHPNVVRVHDIGASQGTVYISMELLNGKSLRQILEGLMPGDRLPMRTVLNIFDQLCAALEYAHRFTVHRDLKPENVMVMEDGSVKLMDFGISKLRGDASLTSASMVMGTPHYMSPEQVKHSAGVDQRADIYSLGVMLYEALTGNLPTAIHKPVSKIVRGVPPALDPIIETCLQDDPTRRYETAAELRAALGAVQEQLGFTESPVTFKPRNQKRSLALGNPRKIAGAMLVALMLTGMGVGLWRAEATRDRLLAEGPPPAPPTVEPPLTGLASAAPTELTAASAMALLPSARARADSAVRALSDGDVKTFRRGMLDEAVTWEEAAAEYRETDPRLTLPAARRALHLYLALAHWPPGAYFVPATDSEAGFFIQYRPVSASDFRAFAQNGEFWRIPAGLQRLHPDHPAVFVTWYDAQACLAAFEPPFRLATEQQWARALAQAEKSGGLRWMGDDESIQPDGSTGGPEQTAESATNTGPAWVPEFWVEHGLMEWTRSGEDPSEPRPGFGDRLRTRGVEKTQNSPYHVTEVYNFEFAGDLIGFRGVRELPMTEIEVRSYLE